MHPIAPDALSQPLAHSHHDALAESAQDPYTDMPQQSHALTADHFDDTSHPLPTQTSQAVVTQPSHGWGLSQASMMQEPATHYQKHHYDSNASHAQPPSAQHQCDGFGAPNACNTYSGQVQPLLDPSHSAQPDDVQSCLQLSQHQHCHQASSLQPLQHPQICDSSSFDELHLTDMQWSAPSASHVDPTVIVSEHHVNPYPAYQHALHQAKGDQADLWHPLCNGNSAIATAAAVQQPLWSLPMDTPALSSEVQRTNQPQSAATAVTDTVGVASQQTCAVAAGQQLCRASTQTDAVAVQLPNRTDAAAVVLPARSDAVVAAAPEVSSAKTESQGWKRVKRAQVG